MSGHIRLHYIREVYVIAMQAGLVVLREHVHKLLLVGEMVASFRVKQLHSLRLLKKYATRRRTNGFDRRGVRVGT